MSDERNEAGCTYAEAMRGIEAVCGLTWAEQHLPRQLRIELWALVQRGGDRAQVVGRFRAAHAADIEAFQADPANRSGKRRSR